MIVPIILSTIGCRINKLVKNLDNDEAVSDHPDSCHIRDKCM